MKCALSIKEPAAARMSPRKFDCGFDAFTARTAEENSLHLPAGEFNQPGAEFARQIGNMALKHSGSATCKFRLESSDNGRVVMTGVVDAIARQEVEKPASV